MVMSKLPSDIRLRVTHETTDELWRMDDLMEVIWKKVKGHEFSEVTKIKSQPSNPSTTIHGHITPTTSAFTIQGHQIQCVYYSGQHYSASCDKVKLAKEHKDILIKSDQCFNCLSLTTRQVCYVMK